MSKTRQLRQKAQIFLKKGMLDKAAEEYRRLLTVESRNPNLYNELGDIYLKAGDRIQAVSCFENASINYEKVALYNNALAVCKKILRVVPNRLETLFKLGELKAKQKFDGEAVNYFIQYLEGVMGESEQSPEVVQVKLGLMMELLPEREELISRVADAYGRIGLTLKAVELLAGLIKRYPAGGDSVELMLYREKVEEFKSSLSSDELVQADQLLAEESPRDSIVEEPDVHSIMEETAGETEMAGSADTDEPQYDAEEVIAGEPPAEQSPPTDEGERETGDAYDIPEQPPYSEEEVLGEEPAATHPYGDGIGGQSTERPAADGAGEQAASVTEDVIEKEAMPRESLASSEKEAIDEDEGINLAEEITSDIEEDDHKSHYDLGMAYLEMALHTEAVKEFQIASRSEQLKLKSIEMIGHCFLLQNNPRLAVKQLLRGLDAAGNSGGDTLGINYNLGLAYEMLGDMEKAREYFEEVYIIDVMFRDIEEKMKKFSTIS